MVTPREALGTSAALETSAAFGAILALLQKADVYDPVYEANEIFKETVGKPPLSCDSVSGEEFSEMERLAVRRAAGEPLQYLFGAWEFYGLRFFVGEGVLIPRPETELLAELSIGLLGQGGKMLDLCSGTGCIAVAAAKNTPAEVTAVERYEAAFSYLQKNIAYHQANVTAILGDALDPAVLSETDFDLIVSNPPYLTKAEMTALQREVRHEPETALYGGEDGLDFYRRLIPLWKGRLKKGGTLAVEVGDGQAAAVGAIFAAAGLLPEIRNDLQGIGRVVFAKS